MSSGSSAGNSIEGCLGGSTGNYTLTDASGMTWQLEGSDAELSKHIGQQVRVSGNSSSSGMGSSAGGSTTPGAGIGSTSGQTFTVTKVHKIASTCKSSDSTTPSK